MKIKLRLIKSRLNCLIHTVGIT